MSRQYLNANSTLGCLRQGNKRESNQDSYLVNESLGLFVVADGMGGHSGGEVASSLRQTLEQEIKIVKSLSLPSREKLYKAYEQASVRIFDKAATDSPELLGMGTTMVSCYLENKKIYISNVGDSRCYLYSDQYLWQVTEITLWWTNRLEADFWDLIRWLILLVEMWSHVLLATKDLYIQISSTGKSLLVKPICFVQTV